MSTLSYSGPATLSANQLFHATLTVALDEPIQAGGSIVLAARHVSDLADAQDREPQAEGYVRVRCSRDGAKLRLSSENVWARHPWNRGFQLTAGGRLERGDKVIVELGGARGFRCQSFCEEAFRFRLGVQPGPDEPFRVTPVDELPGIRVTGNAAQRVRLRVCEPNSRTTRRRICIKLEDGYGNPTDLEEAELDLLLEGGQPIRTARITGAAELLDVPVPWDDSWHRLTASSLDGRFHAVSNPFGPSLVRDHFLYWGEIHSQSGLCDGTGSPGELYRYARRAAGLDFASVTSHDMLLSPEDWAEVQRRTREANEPGRFVTLLGYEWSGGTERGGDSNIYYLGDRGPLVYNGAFIAPELLSVWGDWSDGTRHAAARCRTLAETIKEIRASEVPFLVIPHCGGRAANLDFHDPAVMPVFEVHSCHRNYQDIADQAIQRGLHFGFIGGSDDHRGMPGDSVPAARERFFSSRAGLAGVYARELTREALWEALYARRVFATNGCRMALVFRAGGALMGGEISAATGSAIRLEFEAVLDGYFDHAEIVEDDEVIARFSRNENQILRYADGMMATVRRGAAQYYVRVFQTDGGIAWASPVRVTGV